MEQTLETKPEKHLYLEILRVFAIFGVIFNHTYDKGYFLFATRPIGSFPFWVEMALSIGCKCSVPIFFAISGALLLSRDEPLSVIWRRRILRMAILLLVYSLAYYTVGCWRAGIAFSVPEFLETLYTVPVTAHLWYLYAYLAFLVCLPFLRSMVRQMRAVHFRYMAALGIVFLGVIPVLEYCIWGRTAKLTPHFDLTAILSQIVIYPCIGYYLHTMEKPKRLGLTVGTLWGSYALLLGASCIATWHLAKSNGGISILDGEVFYRCSALPGCMAMFLSAKCLVERLRFSPFAKKLIAKIGACTFGVYLTHTFLMDLGRVQSLLHSMAASMNEMAAAILYCIVVLIVDYLAVWIVMQIPYVRKIVGGR